MGGGVRDGLPGRCCRLGSNPLHLSRHLTMSASQKAIAAVRAVKNVRVWGGFATLQYVRKHGAVTHTIAAFRFEARRKLACQR